MKEHQVQHLFTSECAFFHGCRSIISNSCECLRFVWDLMFQLLLKHLPVGSNCRSPQNCFFDIYCTEVCCRFWTSQQELAELKPCWSITSASTSASDQFRTSLDLYSGCAQRLHAGAIFPPLLHTSSLTCWRETVQGLVFPFETNLYINWIHFNSEIKIEK